MFAGLIIFLLFFSGSTAGFAGGSGTSNDPYQIETCQQLQNMSGDLDANYELVSDIDCSDTENWNSGKGFDPVGGEFDGVFDGNYHTVTDLFINRSGFSGLFRKTYYNAIIENVSVTKAEVITDSNGAAILVANNFGDVENSYVTGRVVGMQGTAGLVGSNYGALKNSFSRANVSSSDINLGGLVGSNGVEIESLYSTGVVGGSSSRKGGLVGLEQGTTKNSYWDINTSNITTSASGNGLTTSEMKNKSNFEGFDFEDTWVIDPEVNDGYPQLQAFVSPDISEFSAEKIEGSKLQVTVKSSQTLKILNVSISGSESAILNRSDFVHNTESNTESYRANYTYSKDGIFKATLDAARSQKESAEASGQTDLAFCDRSAESPSCTVDSFVWGQGESDNMTFDGNLSLQTGGITLTSHDVSVGGYNYDAFIRDLDQDGDKDVIVVNDLEQDARWLENNGSGGFTQRIIGGGNGDTYDATIADFDGDGDQDIAVANLNTQNYWFENDGSESFTRHTLGASDTGSSGIDSADFDGDGDQDIVVANQNFRDHEDSWFQNDGTGDFTRNGLGPTSANRNTRDVEVADFDGDGDLDIFAASAGDSYIWKNDGSGNFVNYSLGGSSTDTEGSAVFDIDGDGDLDVVEANHNQNNYWWENDGSGSFTHHSLNDGTQNNYDIDAADLDGDGDGDIVVSTNNNKDYWLENDGSESFTKHIFTGSTYGRGVDIGDLDGDNDPDIFLPNANDQAKWWENTIDYKAGGNYSSTVFEGLKSVYWSNITVDSELNGGSANVTFEFSEQSDFSSTVSSKTFELSGGEQNLSTGTEARYVRFNISMAPGSSTPVIDSMNLRYKKSDPKLKTQNQEREVAGPDIGNNLSIVVSDLGSGIDRVYLETNESGAFKNRSGYTEDLSGPTSDTLVDFDWGNSSLKGQNLTIGWKVWAVDKTGNWNSSGVETFEFDGIAPSDSGLNFISPLDVDTDSTNLSINISDENGLDTVLIEQNSSGSFTNNTMTNSSGIYNYTVSGSIPGNVELTVYANDTVGNIRTVSGMLKFQNISLTNNLNTSSINASETIELSGRGTLEPDNTPVKGSFRDNATDISTCSELQAMNNNLSGVYELVSDIDCSDTKNWNSGQGFRPIGLYPNEFGGVFYGNNFTIHNLYINRPSKPGVGLFGIVNSEAVINNVHLKALNITGRGEVGGLVGENQGDIIYSSTEGVVVSAKNPDSGGLVGFNLGGSISRSFSVVNVSGEDYSAGLAGDNKGSISYSYARGNVSGTGLKIGGLVGACEGGSISDSYSTGTASGSSNVGGLLGSNDGGCSPSKSYWDTQSSGLSGSDGGTGLKTAEMKQKASFTNWDFTNIWKIKEGETYPQLRFPEKNAVELFRDTGSGYEKIDKTLPESGNSSFNISNKGVPAGTHSLKLTFENDNGIKGSNVSSYNVSLDISNHKSTFNASNSSYIDVDRSNQDLNLSAFVSNSSDSDVDTVLAKVTAPDNTVKSFKISNTTWRNSSQKWFKTIDVNTEFGQMGRYNVTFSANTSRGIGSNYPETSFYVENITVTQNVNATSLRINESFNFSGKALLKPYNSSVSSRNVSIYLNESLEQRVLTNSSGGYNFSLNAPETPGFYDLKVNLTNSDGIKGVNLSRDLKVYNISTSIKSASNYNVFRDTDSSEDISFSDNVTADSRNPGSLNGVNLVYSIPSSWTYVSKDESSNTLVPGEFFTNSPKVDIGADASLGPVVVNTTASSNEGVSSTDNITINIWEKADAEFLNIEDGESIPRDKKYMELRANITGVSSNTGLDNVSTRLIDSAQSYTESSNSSGIVTYNWSVKDLNTGDNQVSLQTQDQVSQYINSTGDLFEQRITVSVLGILKSGHFSISQDSVYRKNGSSPEDTQISGQIEDSNGDGVNQTDVYIDINGTVLHDITDKTGSYSVFYNPPDSMEPGNYTVNVNASKSDFDVLEFNDSVVVKGKASTTNLVSKKIFRRGLPQQLDSFIANEFGDQASLSTKWYLNGSEVATGQNTSWIPSNSVSRGFYNLKVGTDSQFYDNQNDTSQIEVYGLAEIDLKPDTTSILPGNQVDVHVNVSDANTSAPVNGMPVDIFINGTKYTSQTNSSGIAEYAWNPSEGFYNVSAAIQSNKSLRYNVSNSFESSDVTIGKNIYLDSFSITNDEIFRPDLNTYTTKFSVNLSETSSSPENVPGDGINVSFTINGSETVECQTDSLGYCEVNYNPQNVEIGDLDVDVTTSKTDWDDIEETKTLTVKGVLTPKIQKPENSIINRGTNITLETTTSTFSGGEANVPVNWSFRGSRIATGKTASWKPQTIGTSTGPGTLEVSAGEGDIYQEGTDTFEVTVYGLSTVEIESPNNSSKIGYGQSPTVSCHVTDSVDRDIENYPVEFVDNRSGSLTVFANDLTDSNGDATANWDVPNSLGSFRAGCRIADNASLGYNDSTAVSTRVFETKDDVPPSVTNISVPSKVDPGDVATVNFNATDEIEVDRAWIIVEDPNLQEERVFASAVDSDTFKAEYNTSGHPEGGYTVKVRANDTSGNLEKKLDTFNVNPGGSISVSQSLLAVSGITQTQGNNYTVDVSVRINETGGANLVNITSSSSNSSKLDINTSKYTCGSKVKGDYCNRTFKLEVLPGALASPPSVFATFEGEWIAGDSSSVNTFTELNIQRNPKLSEESGNQSFNINHDNSNQVSFTPNATGNYQVEDFYASYISGNLSESWIDLSNDRKSSIDPGSSISTGANVSIPLGQDPGVYVGKINFSSNNTGSLNRQIKATVLEDFSYSVPSTVSVTAIKGASGDLKDVPITHNGNKDFTANPTFSGDVSGFVDADSLNVKKQEMNQLTVYRTTPFSSAGNYITTLTVDSSNPSVSSESVTLDIEVLDFSIGVKTPGTTVNTEPGNYSTAKFNVSVGGTKRTDNLTNNIYVNGTKAKINSENENNGVFTINFTVPDVADARKHDLEIEVQDGKNDVTASETINDRFNVPDSTNPVVSKIDTENIDVGENVTINLTASDNNLNGVLDGIENVSLTLTDPSDSSSIYYMENEGQEWQQKLINLSEKGNYRLEFNVTDAANLSTIKTDYLRVAPRFNLGGSFKDSIGKTQTADVVFVEEETRERTNAKLNGDYNISIQTGTYDVEINHSDNKINLEGVDVNQNTSDPIKVEELDQIDTSSLTPDAEARVMGMGVNTSFNPSSATITFNYSEYKNNIPSGKNLEDLQVARCPEYDYSDRSCGGNFETFNITSGNIDTKREVIEVNVSGFSSYTLFFPDNSEDKIENNDEQEQQQEEDTSGGGGGGGGGLSSSDLEGIEDTLSEINSSLTQNQSQYAEFGSNTISARMKPGETKQVSLSIRNRYNKSQTFSIKSSEVVSEFIEEPSSVNLESGEVKDIILGITVPASELPNSYSGYLNVKSEKIDTNIPVNLNVLPPDKKLLDLSVDPVFESVTPGDTLKVETTFSNQGYARNVDVTVQVEVVDPDTNETVAEKEKTLAVGTTLTRVVSLQIPDDAPNKRYEVRGSARYTNLDVPMVATAVTPVNVQTPFWERSFFEVKYDTLGITLLLILVTSLVGYSAYQYRKQKALEKKRYLEKIDLDTIPSGGKNQAFVGELAEMGKRTFIDLNDLTTHALVAGATGSGKTVTGQGMVEEALKEGKNVIVLDPTAQWTGFLRENSDSAMFQLYKEHGMSMDDAQGFDGNIRAIEPGEEIDITPYLETDEEGQIIVFSLHKLDSKNIDEFVNKTIQQIFDANLPERNGLETLVVYDEVHRLLEKFGGSGEGLKQLERGAREFRKWGVGMVLLSQVITDFSGEIRANIGTMIQMRTQYEKDLNRVKDKFGMDTVRSIAKAKVGAGMVQNSDYNHGRPYFVDFRPLLHSPHRLSDEELEKYEAYNRRVDSLEERIDSMEQQGEEVYEYRSELKLAKRNLKKASFNLVDIYLDELEDDLK